MKKRAFSIVLAVCVMGPFTATQASVVNFNGLIQSQTCTVSLNGDPAATVVLLPTVSKNQLDTAGKTAGDTPFSINLSNCNPALLKAKVMFAGESFNFNGRLINRGTATDLTIQVIDSTSSQPIDFNDINGTISSPVNIVSGEAVMPFVAKYYAENPVGAGTVLASTKYGISYE